MTVVGLSLAVVALRAQTPTAADLFRPGEPIYDTAGKPINSHWGSMLRYHGVYYWFGGIMDGKTVNQHVSLPGVSCYSSRDLQHWKNEGIVMPGEVPGTDLVLPRYPEREKVIYNRRTRKFVMWMHVDTVEYRYARAAVAVSDSPTGPYHYLGSMRPNDSECRDMTVFQDEDGKAYLIFSSEGNATMHIARLTDDYLRPDGAMIRQFVDQWREGPAVFRLGKRYFLINSKCAGWAPSAARYAVASSMLGPWKEMGNPAEGPGADNTFGSQSSDVLRVAGKRGAFIFLADRWKPDDLVDSHYIWLPISVQGDKLEIKWHDQWDLSIFR
jgi:beta-xylosidase